MHKLEQLYNETAKRFNNDLNIIIQAFINFYGVENSEYIINKISNSRIIWYDDSNRDDDIQNQIISSINGDELTEILKKRKKEAFLQSAYIDEIDVLILPLNYDLTHIIHEINSFQYYYYFLQKYRSNSFSNISQIFCINYIFHIFDNVH